MLAKYRTNPWLLPEMTDYPLFPFRDIDLWHLANIYHELIVREEDFPSGVGFHLKNRASIRSRDAFLSAGILMSPAIYNSSAAWGFYLEHVESLRNSSGTLRINSSCIHWDERVRTIFAERFGLGLAGWLLWNSHDVLHIADASPFIAKTVYDSSSPYHKRGLHSLGLYGKNGGLKPDLFCLTKSGVCVIAESKGAIGPPSRLASAKKKGKQQVENVNPVGVSLRKDGGRLVFASNFRHENENPQTDKDSCITVVDPEMGEEGLNVNVTANDITLHSYCKVLSFCGLSNVARILLQGKSIEGENVDQWPEISVEGNKIVPLLQREGFIVGLDKRVANALFRNSDQLFIETREVLAAEETAGIISTERTFRLPNGFIFADIE